MRTFSYRAGILNVLNSKFVGRGNYILIDTCIHSVGLTVSFTRCSCCF